MISIYTVTINTDQHSYIDIDVVAASLDEVTQTVAREYGDDVRITAITWNSDEAR